MAKFIARTGRLLVSICGSVGVANSIYRHVYIWKYLSSKQEVISFPLFSLELVINV